MMRIKWVSEFKNFVQVMSNFAVWWQRQQCIYSAAKDVVGSAIAPRLIRPISKIENELIITSSNYSIVS